MEQDRDCVTLSKILQFADIRDQEVLEIGCGDGRITTQLIGKAKKLVAIDPEAANIAEAKETMDGVGLRIGSGECLEFPSESFDVILFTLSLHHQDSSVALREAKRVLRDHGRVMILEPVNDGEIEQVCNFIQDETRVLQDALRAIEASDFEVERSEVFYTYWEFENEHELYEWLFTYYQKPFDNSLVVLIGELLGDKVKSPPIILQDKIMIISLRKHITQD
ncbi:MAG: class I SAM-dependent methyltransferase [Deltaproteobacteria bacterium]|nr:class I SAM-dependent methyltransferase [Deltaproteobacteria bacterium]MBW2333527.1 class I SAM-dependent methyltransferase [Deltaproteobacteria bacterium]